MAIPRLQSIDAARGLTVAAMLVVNDAGDWLAACGVAASIAMPAIYLAAFAAPLAGAGPFAASLAYAVVFTGAWWCLAVVARHRGWRWST